MYAITDVFGARKRSSNRHRCPRGLFCCYETRFFSGCDLHWHGLLPLPALSLPLQQPRSDFVQVVGEYTKAHVTLKAIKAFIQTSIKAVMLEAVNVRLNCLVPVAQRPK